jgi:hypothetical protein
MFLIYSGIDPSLLLVLGLKPLERSQVAKRSKIKTTRKTMYYQQKKSCSANVTVNRNRLKIYEDVAYLKDGQHFEIELFNPTDQTHLAKISLNGRSISNSGIVLKPGERIFLERFIDEDRKFLFETYDVENSQEAREAIQNNGILKIEFFSQLVLSFGGTTSNTFWYNGSGNYWGGTTTLGNGKGITFTNTGGIGSLSTLNTSAFSSTASNLASTQTQVAGSLETGRVEKGEKSDQSFTNYYGSFHSYADTTVSIKLMPASTKPVEKKEIRNYCTGCGTRMKKSSWKFCPSCGAKLD